MIKKKFIFKVKEGTIKKNFIIKVKEGTIIFYYELEREREK